MSVKTLHAYLPMFSPSPSFLLQLSILIHSFSFLIVCTLAKRCCNQFLMEGIFPRNPTEAMPGLTLALFIWRQRKRCPWGLSIPNLNGFLHLLLSLSTLHVLSAQNATQSCQRLSHVPKLFPVFFTHRLKLHEVFCTKYAADIVIWPQ